ncbi:hypothetical protein [Spirosoma montaniterrae]|uniref:Uncharacterized protein n=1 Tax=Spirosoma montaniterrae TaxID=1178516 RepID=A0A1P9X055_9BACT|nr:hypothetical protein [Spirosoma montaniterrae]AQG81002.1 hypothetical protein AWR27_17750 [Spirosoma montaniterrae]
MEKTGQIEIRITGTKGSQPLKPDNFDIREVMAVLEQVEGLLFPADKRDRPTISYRIEEGSVRHLFRTSLQYVIGFGAVIGQVAQRQDINFLELNTARALEAFQTMAVQRGYTFSIRTSETDTHELRIDPDTKFYRTESVWAEAEFYFYGKVTNAGGKDRANIHVSTDDYGLVIIKTPISVLEQLPDNILYRSFGVRVVGKQHVESGELDRSDLRFVELIDYHPTYDDSYLSSLRERAKKSWLGHVRSGAGAEQSADPDAWLRELRGSYDA